MTYAKICHLRGKAEESSLILEILLFAQYNMIAYSLFCVSPIKKKFNIVYYNIYKNIWYNFCLFYRLF